MIAPFLVEASKALERLESGKFNPYHGDDGRFTSGGGGSLPVGHVSTEEELTNLYSQASVQSRLQTRYRTHLPKDQDEALGSYSGGNYKYINRSLRGQDLEIPDFGHGLPPPTTHERIQRETHLIDHALAEAPSVTARFAVSRYVSESLITGLTPGDLVHDNAFISTTRKQRGNPRAKAVTVIHVPEGAKALDISYSSVFGRREQETLLPRGTKFRVLSNTTVQGVRRVEMEMLL